MNTYGKYRNLLQQVADISNSIGVLSWDQEVYLPSKSGHLRARQIATLSGIAHEKGVSEDLGKWLNDLEKDGTLNEKQKRNVKESLRDYRKRKKYPTDFVIRMNQTTSEAFMAWHEAKEKSDFSIFQPLLEKLIVLKLEECELLGYNDHPYNALLDNFEPGASVKELDGLFDNVRKHLVPFVREIISHPVPDTSFLRKKYPRQKQWDHGIELLRQMNYDFEKGRQDLAPHPFSIGFGPDDVRITTRISEDNPCEMLFSTIHECGHALYEMGLSPEEYGLPEAEAVSLGIHESQSRLWENHVGRSLAYWKANYRRMQEIYPDNLAGVPLEDFYRAINVVQPSLIRTNADELTYHLHVLIRYEIEKALLERAVKAADLPALWNAKYKEYLGVDVPSDSKGVLQDIHWSHGSFGYFPTYSIGSFYAAQFFQQAGKELNNLDGMISERNLLPLLNWLREKIHRHGRLYSAAELCQNITGEKLNFTCFMNYAKRKYEGIYEKAGS